MTKRHDNLFVYDDDDDNDGYLAQQIVQMFITIKIFCLRFINIVSTATLLNMSIQSRTFLSVFREAKNYSPTLLMYRPTCS